MLTIKNLFKIRNKTLDKKNFYVFDVYEYPEQYKFEITNRQFIIQIFLNRTQLANGYYELRCDYGQQSLMLAKAQIQNLDILLDKIRFVGIK
jgi:hypothetical protein